MRTRKQGKTLKDKLSTIKKFLNGKSITEDIKPSEEKRHPQWFVRFIDAATGEDVTEQVNNPNAPSWSRPYHKHRELKDENGETMIKMVPAEGCKPLSCEIDGRPVSVQEYEQHLAEEQEKGNFIWEETKTYLSETSEKIERSELIGSSNLDDLPIEAIKPQKKKEAKIEAGMKPGGKEWMQARLREMQEQEKIDLADRNEMLIWKAMNYGDIKIIR